MKNKTIFKKGNRILLYAIILVILVQFRYYLLKLGGFVLIVTIPAFVLLLILVVFQFYHELKEITKRKKDIKATLRLVVSFLMLTLLLIPNFLTDENFIQSKVEIKAYRKSTMNFSELYFREDNSYELINIGWFGYVNHSTGSWKRNRDTLLLYSKKELPVLLGEKNLIKNSNIYRLEGDSIFPTHFKYYFSE